MRPVILLFSSVLLFCACQKNTKINGSNLITITSDKDTLYTNQQQHATLTITLSNYHPDVRLDLKVVNGTIDGSTELSDIDPGGTTLVRTMVPDANASVAYITATVSGSDVSVTREIVLLSNTGPEVLTLSLQDTVNSIADEFSYFQVKATVNNVSAGTAHFTTSQGTFANGHTDIDVPISNHEATATIVTGQNVTLYEITCTLQGTNYSANVYFTPGVSYPQTLQVVPEAWSIDSASQSAQTAVSIDAVLQKTQGKVSIGRPVVLRAYQVVGGNETPVGTFTPVNPVSTADQTVNFGYYNTPNVRKQPLFIEVKTQSENGMLSQTIQLEVQ